jgi:hypothetical protein
MVGDIVCSGYPLQNFGRQKLVFEGSHSVSTRGSFGAQRAAVPSPLIVGSGSKGSEVYGVPAKSVFLGSVQVPRAVFLSTAGSRPEKCVVVAET